MPKKKCFIVMPVSTPKELVDVYSGDKDHFLHVLDLLFTPAVEKAGFEAIPPVAKGAELIHAEIIQNIESADYLLCDMSSLNPNVFFELGIRTAVNKPIALVRDDATARIPFDTNIINNHTYSHALAAWTLDEEINKLSMHLKQCFKSDKTDNSLWKYFSLSSKAEPLDKPTTENEKIGYLGLQIEALRQEIKEKDVESIGHQASGLAKEENLIDIIKYYLDRDNVDVSSILTGAGLIRVKVKSLPTTDLGAYLVKRAKSDGYTLTFKVDK